MAKDKKFGTFGGVYTPSLLTILGVIMYLRLPWVAGHAGFAGAFGIILVAHIISISTGLSISSIATDKNVGAGGPYYIVSRSLGLPIGGALGLALFTGLCFSTSLYVIGLSESILSTLGVEATPNAIRITGTISLAVITAVTIISTEFALKAQYVVLGLIAISLLAVFLGNPDAATPGNAITEPAPSMALLFGIFFPAVTGFTAGVNLSGDLKDPKRAIPHGTMAAVFTGLLTYMGLAFFLLLQVGPEILQSQPDVLLQVAVHPAAVIAGIWGATFSSGLGSILGAPRIVQAMSVDRITPAFFAKGNGPSNEPRNALILSVLLAEAGILIAELNAIARIVSMVFLTMYAFLNISCAIEAKVSPDFRPAFRIPVVVSVVGAATCAVIMIQLDLAAMLGATAIMVGLYLLLARKQLELEAGDAWQGVWSSLVRSGLYRITGTLQKQRNWRPNIVAFHPKNPNTQSYDDFASALITGNGILTDFEIVAGTPRGKRGHTPLFDKRGEAEVVTQRKAQRRRRQETKQVEEERSLGWFRRRLYTEASPFDEIAAVCRHFGFSGLEPNALLLPYGIHKLAPAEFRATLDAVADQDLNVLLYKHCEVDKKSPRIDIWWRPEQGNIAFCLAILRFLTRARVWEKAKLRFLLMSHDSAENDKLRSTMHRLLREQRISAAVKVESDTFDDRSFADRIRGLSEDASLTIVGLPNESGQLDESALFELEEVTEHLSGVLWVRGSSEFKEILPIGRSATVSELPPEVGSDGTIEELPELSLPDIPDIVAAVSEFSDSHQRLVGRLSEQCFSKVYGRHIELIRDLRGAAERFLDAEAMSKASNPKRQRTTFNRQQSSLLMECESQLSAFMQDDIDDLRSVLEGSVDSYLHDESARGVRDEVRIISRPRAHFLPQSGDNRLVKQVKRHARFFGWLLRRDPQIKVRVGQLKRYYFQKSIHEVLDPSLRTLTTDTHQLMVLLGKLLNSSRARHYEGDDVSLERLVAVQRGQLLTHLDEMDRRSKSLLRRRKWSLIVAALETANAYAEDLCRFDIAKRMDKERSHLETISSESSDLPAAWAKAQKKLSEHARLALTLSGIQHRVAAIYDRSRVSIDMGLKSGAARSLTQIGDEVARLEEKWTEGQQFTQRSMSVEPRALFTPEPVLESLKQELSGIADDLPQEFVTLTDDSMQALEEGRDMPLAETAIPVRRLVHYLVESELIAGLSRSLVALAKVEQRSLVIAQDVARLVNFQLQELPDAHDANESEFALQPIFRSSQDRLSKELSALLASHESTLKECDEKLHLVVEGTNAYDLSRTTEKLEAHLRLSQGRRAVSGARGFLQRAWDRTQYALARLIHRRSDGALLAEKSAVLHQPTQVSERLARLVRNSRPKAEVLSGLPFYYRQLFTGQSSINESFWAGRSAQLDAATAAKKQFASRQPGCIIVTGPRLSGKTALLQKMMSDAFDKQKAVRVLPVPGGSSELAAFEASFRKAMGSDPSLEETPLEGLFAALPVGTLVVIDDLHLWWHRGANGNQLVERISEAIRDHAGRLLFVLSAEPHALMLMNLSTVLSGQALCHLRCDPLSSRELERAIMSRHGSTGLSFAWKGRPENRLSAVERAQLFMKAFDESGGRVGSALRTWVASIERIKGQSLEMRTPSRRDWEVVDELPPEQIALLVQLLLHKQLSFERMENVTGLPGRKLQDQLEPLLKSGLVVESQRRVLELDGGALLAIETRLVAMGVLA